MSVVWKVCTLASALCFAGSHPLVAQQGLEGAYKLRVGLATSQPKDHLSRRTLGFGLELGYQSSVGRFSVELGYQYKPGDQYLADVTTFPVATGANPPSPAASVDSRKSNLDGMTLRLAYGTQLSETVAWQAGVQLGGSKYREEYLADVADANWATYEDTYNGVARHNANAVSPFAGVRLRITATSSLEINAVALRYTSATYVHTAGTVKDWGAGHTSKDTVSTTSRVLPHLELGYVIRF